MFISKYEKEEMRISVRALQAEVKDLQEQIRNITYHISTNQAPAAIKRQGRSWNSESKSAASERMKKYWSERKAKKETS